MNVGRFWARRYCGFLAKLYIINNICSNTLKKHRHKKTSRKDTPKSQMAFLPSIHIFIFIISLLHRMPKALAFDTQKCIGRPISRLGGVGLIAGTVNLDLVPVRLFMMGCRRSPTRPAYEACNLRDTISATPKSWLGTFIFVLFLS